MKMKRRKMMAKVKECYEKKQTVKLVGLLDKDENDEYIVCVDEEQYSLKDILEELWDSGKAPWKVWDK